MPNWLKYSTVEVVTPKQVIDQFKEAAKEAYPLETIAYLIGYVQGSKCTVTSLYFSKSNKGCTKVGINTHGNCKVAAKKLAASQNQMVVGDIHSHPYNSVMTDLAPSTTDWLNQERDLHLMGICVVYPLKNGSKRAHVRFWGPAIVAELKVL